MARRFWKSADPIGKHPRYAMYRGGKRCDWRIVIALRGCGSVWFIRALCYRFKNGEIRPESPAIERCLLRALNKSIRTSLIGPLESKNFREMPWHGSAIALSTT